MFDCLRRENNLEIPKAKFLDESGKNKPELKF